MTTARREANRARRVVLALFAVLSVLGCTLPWLSSASSASATMVVETVWALQTSMAESQTARSGQSPPVASLESPTSSATPFSTPVPSKPIVHTTALCWTGPGSAYPVVSGVKEGSELTVLGVGSAEGWLIVENPIYRDRCWIQIENLTLDPYFSTAGLKLYNPPPTPGPKYTPTPTPEP